MLRRHHVIRAAIRLARDHGDLRHGRLGIGEQQFRAMLDNAVQFLRGARQEARHVDEGDDRNFERIAEPHEPCRLLGRIDVEAPGEHHRLVGDEADRAALDPPEADDDVGGMRRLHLEEIALVDRLPDQLVHVVRLIGARRHQLIETVLNPVPRVRRRTFGRRLAVRCGKEVHEVAGREQRLDIVLEGHVCDPRLRGMRHSTPEFLLRDDLVGNGLHYIRAGDEHIR
ncbi:unnamed protein product [Rhizophagus irregularis]|uniref:Uncharacterized protein n=1 Tax=Rhizophagus irregularis TaxID=588596 RepID=A0A916EHQ4_9GLOM|nr:unnamed protein product [Rhizophagus irregularis]